MSDDLFLRPVSRDRLSRVTGLQQAREYEAEFPKEPAASKAEARETLRSWMKEASPPPIPRNDEVAARGVRPDADSLARLQAVTRSEAPTGEALRQKLDAPALLGTLYSALTAFEYLRVRSEYEERREKAKDIDRVEAEWENVVEAMRTAYRAAGVTDVGREDLERFGRLIAEDDGYLDTVSRIADSAEDVEESGELTGGTEVLGFFVPDVALTPDDFDILIPIPNLCEQPFAEGTYTKHFSKSFTLRVRLKVPCPTWTNPFRMCWKTFELAGVSFSLGLEVGYRITCCGASVWGQAYAEACASIVGIEVCADCSATVQGVAGLSRTPTSDGECQYGLGVEARLECRFEGHTVFSATAPFGWTVTAPCPPEGLCD